MGHLCVCLFCFSSMWPHSFIHDRYSLSEPCVFCGGLAHSFRMVVERWLVCSASVILMFTPWLFVGLAVHTPYSSSHKHNPPAILSFLPHESCSSLPFVPRPFCSSLRHFVVWRRFLLCLAQRFVSVFVFPLSMPSRALSEYCVLSFECIFSVTLPLVIIYAG